MKRAAVIASIVLSLTVVSSGAGGAPKGITPATVLALQSWIQAVKTHTPGRPDAVPTATLRRPGRN
jgi:hypothetical protein